VKRPAYRDAIRWMADNDDILWLDDRNGCPSVTACLVADLFGVTDERVTADLRRRRDQDRGQGKAP
jgi:hypothetical protein